MAGFLAKFGPFAFDAGSGELTRNGVAVSLQKQSRIALRLLLERPGSLVTRDQFREELWKDVNVDFENGLNTTIARLRQKLGAEYGSRIKAEPKQGYWFDAAVSIENAAVEPPPASVVRDYPQPEPGSNEPAVKHSFKFRAWAVGGAASAALVCLMAWLVFRGGSFHERLPLVARIDQITNDGSPKSRYITADQDQVYLNEMADRSLQLFRVRGSGGKPHPVAIGFESEWPEPQDSNMTDGGLLVTLNSGMVIWSPASNIVRRISDTSCDVAKWSPDFRHIACSVPGSLYVMNADGSQQRLLRQVASVETIAWTSDSERIRYSGSTQLGEPLSLHEIDAGDGSHDHSVASDRKPVIAGLFVRDAWFSISGDDHDVYVRSARGQVAQLTHGPTRFYSLAANKAGSVLYAMAQRERGELALYDTKARMWRPFLEGVSADGLTWSPDGKYLAYITYPDRELWRSRADGSEPQQLTSAPVQAYHPAWSPDGSQIAYEGRSGGGIWRLMVIPRDGGSPKEIAPLTEPQLQERDPDWSPDGRSIAFSPMADATPANQLGLYEIDVRSGRVQRLPGAEGLSGPKWAPDQSGLLALNRENEIVFYEAKTSRVKVLTDGSKAWLRWTNGGRDVCFLDGLRQTIGCVQRNGLRVKDVARIPFVITGNTFSGGWDYNFWAGFRPDGAPVVLRNRGLSELYAIQLQW